MKGLKMRPDEYTVIDIETYPNEDMIDRLPEPKIDSRLKDPVKIEAAKIEAKDKQIQEMALSPLYGKIACVGYEKGKGNVDVAIDEDETRIIKHFFEHIIPLGQTGSPKIVTWNGMNFDVPFLYKRAMILGIKPTVNMSYFMKRYQVETHCDLMQVWCGWYGYEKLDNVSQAVLGYGKVEFDVTTIKDLMKTPEGREKISVYCKGDIKATSELFNLMANVLF